VGLVDEGFCKLEIDKDRGEFGGIVDKVMEVVVISRVDESNMHVKSVAPIWQTKADEGTTIS
jgi:hypothetical protein